MFIECIQNKYRVLNTTVEFIIETVNKLSIISTSPIEITDYYIKTGDIMIRLGDVIKVTLPNKVSTTYTCNYISKEDLLFPKIYLTEYKVNTSLLYILPTLGKDAEYFKPATFINTCLITKNVRYLYIIARKTDTMNYIAWINLLKSHSLFISSFKNKSFMYLKFQIPEKNIEDVKLLLQGKFSKISNLLKQQILQFFDYNMENSYIAQVLYKSPKLKKMMEQKLDVKIPKDIELYSKPTLQLEFWD